MRIMICIFIGFLCFLSIVISAYINEKRKYLIWKRNTATYPVKNAHELINNTNEFILLISDRIDEEINIHFQKYVLLQEKYPLTKLDDDIKIIAENVYNGIKSSIFEMNKDDFALKTEYFLTLIINNTKLKVTGYMKEWNDKLNTNIFPSIDNREG